MFLFFVFFFLSGFCGLLYQVVWLRIAMADFGVTTALVSIVLSVFMAGLALGSWGGGRLVRRFEDRSSAFFVRLYAASEFVIGISGLVVAPLLHAGRAVLTAHNDQAAWGSAGYYFASGGWVTLILLPFCTAMGATFPLAMAGIRAAFQERSPRSFSYLYLANVMGATSGAFVSAFVLIELIGFAATLLVAAGMNALIALLALILAARLRGRSEHPAAAVDLGSISREVSNLSKAEHIANGPARFGTTGVALPLLFTTGLASLAMEVVWTRQFMPVLGPVVYSFAALLTVYLFATAVGSRIYRGWMRRRVAAGEDHLDGMAAQKAALLAACFALLPLLAVDPRIPGGPTLGLILLRIAGGVGLFCGVLGFLTPMLVDQWSGGDPDRAGQAYAVNALGCIAGPLLSGFVLLPWVGERWTLVLLALPLFAFGMAPLRREKIRADRGGIGWNASFAAAGALLLIAFTKDFESLYPGARVLRDHTATVIAAGEGMKKQLLVNGIGITNLTPITKMMVHLSAASLPSPPRRILILCFGMGTSFRSALSWGVPVTAVDLVPSVPKFFSYFHKDGDELARSPQATIVIDDARRYLERTEDMFDVIAIDPPPPIEAAGTSLLYSREFYEIAKRRLRRGGILQQWIPGREEAIVLAAEARALEASFNDVCVMPSVEHWGHHFLASMSPIQPRTAAELAARTPPRATTDLLEWGPNATAKDQFQVVLSGEQSLRKLIEAEPSSPMLTDDRAVNEYYFLRRLHANPFRSIH